MAKVLGKCVKNVYEFSMAFDVVMSMRGVVEKLVSVAEDGEKRLEVGEESVGSQLSAALSQVSSFTNQLADSRKNQFLSEACALY